MATTETALDLREINETSFVVEGSYDVIRALGGPAHYAQELLLISELGEEAGISNPTLSPASPRWSTFFRGLKNEALCRAKLASLINHKVLDQPLLDKIVDLMRPYVRHGQFGCTQLFTVRAKLFVMMGLTLHVRDKR